MNAADAEQRVTIGKILKARGVRGEVKVLSLTDIPNRFEQLERVIVYDTRQRDHTLDIENVSYYKGFVYLCFVGKNSIEDIKEYIGSTLQVRRSDVPDLPEGTYYHFEIIGSIVYTDDGRRLGTVKDILETSGKDVYVIQGDEREYLIPATEDIVRQIDRDNGTIIIHPLQGLLDI